MTDFRSLIPFGRTGMFRSGFDPLADLRKEMEKAIAAPKNQRIEQDDMTHADPGSNPLSYVAVRGSPGRRRA